MKNVLTVVILLVIFLPCWFLLSMFFEARDSIHREFVSESPNIGRAVGSMVAAYLSVFLTGKIVKNSNKRILFLVLTILAILLLSFSLVGFLLYATATDTTDLLIMIGLDILVAGAIILGAHMAAKS